MTLDVEAVKRERWAEVHALYRRATDEWRAVLDGMTHESERESLDDYLREAL